MTAHDKLIEELVAINLAPAMKGRQEGENGVSPNSAVY